MKLLTFTLPKNHNLLFFGDKHDGTVLTSDEGWDVLVKMLRSKYEGCSNNYAADGGDMIEAIMVDDPRYSAEKLTEPAPLEQMNVAVKRREAIKGQLLWILDGNHECKLWRFGNLTKDICDRLSGSKHTIEYGTYTTKATILDDKGNLMYKVFDTHGSRSITSRADDPIRRRTNMELILKRQLKRKAGDCAVMIKHHVHKLIVCKPESELYLTDDGENIKQYYTGWGQNEPYIHPDARWYGCAGSLLRLYGKGTSGYAEKGEYDPTELGWLILRVRDGKIVSLDSYYLKI